jgi:hypothetical protein
MTGPQFRWLRLALVLVPFGPFVALAVGANAAAGIFLWAVRR